jgi:hypothetical protein
MGFRLRKSFGFGPIRATLSKSGISTSVGVKGARITKKVNGNTMTTISIPNSGISYVKENSNKNNKTNNMTSSNIRSSSVKNYNLIPDPHAIQKKPSGISYAIFVIWHTLMSFIMIVIGCGINPILGILTFIIVVIRISIKVNQFREKWIKNFQLLKQPVEYEKWEDPILTPNPFEGLTKEQLNSYFTILEYCSCKSEKEPIQNIIFKARDLNVAMNTTTTTYMLNTLYEFGYLEKLESNNFSISITKMNYINSINDEKRRRYDEFIKECESYNDEVRKYNLSLMSTKNRRK